MKHVTAISKSIPGGANEIQDIICSFAHAIATFVESKGGFSPAIDWLDSKCDLPDPNP